MTWSKRRRLAREKNEIETPRISGCHSGLLLPSAHALITDKPVPRVGDRVNRTFDWSSGATLSKMAMEEAASDLHLMEVGRLRLGNMAEGEY